MIVQTASSPLFAPDLVFDSNSRPWAAWIRHEGGRDEVVVLQIDREKAWIVNGPGLPGALSPKLLVSSDGDVWVIWTGRSTGHDRIYSSRLVEDAWSAPLAIPSDARYPQISPSACLDTGGRPCVVWSGYDGNDYEIFTSSWTGSAWTGPGRITDNTDADLNPVAAFVPGAGITAFWSKSALRGHAVAAAIRTDGGWTGETVIGEFRKNPVRSLGLAASGGRIGLSWTSGDETFSRVGGAWEILESAGGVPRGSGKRTEPPPFNPNRDENQYTTFGDSITYAEGHGYQASLEARLISKFGAARIWNEGFGGETTAEGLVRIDTAIAAHPSRYLLLMEGANDVIFLDISMESAAFDLEEMARRAMRAGMLPLIVTIIPRNDWRWTTAPFQSRIIELNGRIRELAEILRIPLVDMYEAFFSYPKSQGGWQALLLLDDGVHPNAVGFEVMAGAWFGGIVVLPFPPVNIRAARAINKILFRRQAGNILLWRNSSKLDPTGIIAYRIYRKGPADAAFPAAYLAAIPFQRTALEFRFFDSTIDIKRVYEYVITALRADGVEGPCSDIARDDIY